MPSAEFLRARTTWAKIFDVAARKAAVEIGFDNFNASRNAFLTIKMLLVSAGYYLCELNVVKKISEEVESGVYLLISRICLSRDLCPCHAA